MKLFSDIMRGVARAIPLLLLLLLIALVVPSPAQAQGGIAVSGSFYRQNFEIPQGSSVSGPSIYMVVFNNASEEFQVRMTWDAPLGVNVSLSDEDFLLEPGEQHKVFVGLEVTPEATPGQYTVDITAESFKQEEEGIRLMGAIGQSANLVVLGDSASVNVQTLSPSGEPVVTVIRLFRVISDENFEVSYSDDGKLEANVSPGSFVASAYISSNILAEESFQLAAWEDKTVILTVATVFFEGFSIVPYYLAETDGRLAYAELVYTINNLYQLFPGAKVMLEVTYEGSSEDEIELVTMAPLEKGRVGLKYNYQPKAGWKQGSYIFHLQLYIEGKIYTISHEEVLEVVEPSADESDSGKSGSQWPLIGGIASGSMVLLGVIAIPAKRRLIKGRQ